MTSTFPCHLLLTLMVMIVGMTNFGRAENIFGEADQQDLEKASALAKTHFWRHLAALWDCDRVNHNKKFHHLGEKMTKSELDEICKKWGPRAMAINAYIKYWEFKNGNLAEKEEETNWKRKKTQEENEFNFLSVRPRFIIDGKELLLSSAMQPIMAVYRDLFRWGHGEGLKMEMNFVNQSAWKTADQWVRAFKNVREPLILSDLERIKTMLRAAKRFMDTPDPYLTVYGQNPSKFPLGFENPPKEKEETGFGGTGNRARLLLMQTDEEVFEEKIPNSYKKRSLIKEFMEMYPSISERMEELKQRPKDGNLIAGTDENYQKMWNLGVDMGLGMAPMCSAGLAHKQQMEKEARSSKLRNKLAKFGHSFSEWKTSIGAAGDLSKLLPLLEKGMGKFYWVYNVQVLEPYMEKQKMKQQDKDDRKEEEKKKQIQIRDPCEEAKLRAWATGGEIVVVRDGITV